MTDSEHAAVGEPLERRDVAAEAREYALLAICSPQPDLGARSEHDVAIAADRERTACGCNVGGDLGCGARRKIDPPDDAVRERRRDPAVCGRETEHQRLALDQRIGAEPDVARGGPEHELIVDERGLLEVVAEIDRLADGRDDPSVVRAIDDDGAMTAGHGHELRDADHRTDVDGLVVVKVDPLGGPLDMRDDDHVAGHERRRDHRVVAERARRHRVEVPHEQLAIARRDDVRAVDRGLDRADPRRARDRAIALIGE